MIREGIPATAIESILSALRLSQTELAHGLGISGAYARGSQTRRRTEQRRIVEALTRGAGCSPDE